MQPKSAGLIAAFAATVPAANWLIGHVGTTCIPNGPCLLPVGFGLTAPSGVLMVGASLFLRDLVHEIAGIKGALIAIAIGAAAAWFIAPPALVLASVAAFLLSELADLLVYAPLRERRIYSAIILSGIAGAAVDSAAFLWLAFGSLDFLAGQVLGKVWMAIIAAAIVFVWRGFRPAREAA